MINTSEKKECALSEIVKNERERDEEDELNVTIHHFLKTLLRFHSL